jgi:putative hemolysin
MNLAFAMFFLLAAMLLRAGHEALRSSSRIRLRHMVDENAAGARAASVHLDHPEYLRAAMLAWECALTVSGSLLLAAGALTERGAAIFVSGLLVGTLVFASAMALVGALARSIGAPLFAALGPVMAQIAAISTRVLPPLSSEQFAAEAAAYATEEGEREAVEELIEEGLREGIGDKEDMKLVSGVVDLRDTRVGEVMVPRHEIFALATDMPPGEIAGRMAASGYSRVPIYSGDLDTIVGIFHVLDVLKAGPRDLPPLRPVVSVEQDERCSELLIRMLRQQAHICIVTDGAGHTTGLVTLEDLLEEIVGEIRDEFDEPAPLGGGDRSRIVDTREA